MDPYLTPHTKMNSKCSRDPSERAKTITLLEENIGQNLHDLIFDTYNIFLDITLKTQTTKGKVDKLDFTSIKIFCATKDIINRVKWKTAEWEKYWQIV